MFNNIREVLNGTPVTNPAPTDPTDPTDLAGSFEVLYLPGWNPDPTLSIETTATAAELRQYWLDMADTVQAAGEQMTAAGDRWRESTDPLIRERLWADYESASRNFRVLASWKDVFYAAYTFATDGATCAATGFTPPPAPQSSPREF